VDKASLILMHYLRSKQEICRELCRNSQASSYQVTNAAMAEQGLPELFVLLRWGKGLMRAVWKGCQGRNFYFMNKEIQRLFVICYRCVNDL